MGWRATAGLSWLKGARVCTPRRVGRARGHVKLTRGPQHLST